MAKKKTTKKNPTKTAVKKTAVRKRPESVFTKLAKEYGITGDEARFLYAYLIELQPREAYARAFPKRVENRTRQEIEKEGMDFFKNEKIIEIIDTWFHEYYIRYRRATKMRLLKEFDDRAFYNIFDYIDDRGEFLANMDMEKAGKLIKAIKRSPVNTPSGIVYRTEVEFMDRERASENLLKILDHPDYLQITESNKKTPVNEVANELRKIREKIEK